MKLKKIVEKVIDNRGKTPPLVDNGYELLEVNAVNESSRTPDYQKVRKFVSKDTYENWFRTGNITYNDILIPTVGTIGGCCISKQERGSIAQNLIALRINKQIADPDYIFYYFRTSFFKKELLNLDIGGVQPSIKVPHLLNLEISLPPLSEQKRISSILSSFDNKIEQLKKENNILEDIAQSIFKEWFVKYNFPNKEGKPYKDNNGKMINSELGLIPEGWRVGKIKDLVEIKNGFAFKSQDYRDSGSPIIRAMNFEETGYINKQSLIYLSEIKAKEYKDFNLNEFDLCVVMVGASLGKTALVTKINIPALQNQNIWSFKPRKEINRFYNNLLLKDLVKHNLKSASGSAREFFRKDYFYNMPVAIPDGTTISNFDNKIRPIFNSLSNNLWLINTLSNIKESLLSKLIT